MSMFKSMSVLPLFLDREQLECWTYNLTHFSPFSRFSVLSAEMKVSVPFNFLPFLMTQKCPGACTEHPWSCWKLDTNFNALVISSCSCCVSCRVSRSRLQETSYQHLPAAAWHKSQRPNALLMWRGDVLGTPGSLFFCTGKHLALEVCVHVCARACCKMETVPELTSSYSVPCKHHGNSQWCPIWCYKQLWRAAT